MPKKMPKMSCSLRFLTILSEFVVKNFYSCKYSFQFSTFLHYEIPLELTDEVLPGVEGKRAGSFIMRK